MKATYYDSVGKSEDLELTPEIFDVQVNVPILHAVIRAQLAAARSGTHSTKTRAEVRGGGRKPWRQKGTGRARHGSIREPQWVGGGVAHGPKPRDYSMRINRKEKGLALRSALTDRAREGKVIVIDFPAFEEPETKRAVQLLKDWGALGKVLLVTGPEQDEQVNAYKSFRNLPEVLLATYPTPYTVLASDTVVITKQALALLKPPASKVTAVAAEVTDDPN
ncbi:MAG: 50S ribosomal protein L4 [Actinomycetota bacterium]